MSPFLWREGEREYWRGNAVVMIFRGLEMLLLMLYSYCCCCWDSCFCLLLKCWCCFGNAVAAGYQCSCWFCCNCCFWICNRASWRDLYWSPLLSSPQIRISLASQHCFTPTKAFKKWNFSLPKNSHLIHCYRLSKLFRWKNRETELAKDSSAKACKKYFQGLLLHVLQKVGYNAAHS